MAVENAVNYALRIIKPILDGRATAVDVTAEAEEQYVEQVQNDLQKTVWFSGCSSWYNKEVEGRKPRNSMAYPYSQAYFWYQCLFPVYTDFVYDPAPNSPRRSSWTGVLKAALFAGVFLSAGGFLIADKNNAWNLGGYLPMAREQLDYWRSTISLWN